MMMTCFEKRNLASTLKASRRTITVKTSASRVIARVSQLAQSVTNVARRVICRMIAQQVARAVTNTVVRVMLWCDTSVAKQVTKRHCPKQGVEFKYN